jgi:hypothetical protein
MATNRKQRGLKKTTGFSIPLPTAEQLALQARIEVTAQKLKEAGERLTKQGVRDLNGIVPRKPKASTVNVRGDFTATVLRNGYRMIKEQ